MSILAVVVVQGTSMIFGQDDEQPIGRRRWEQRVANLSPEERQKLQAAHQQAMQDPAVEAARAKMREASKDFRDAMRAAMLRADPSIRLILNKNSTSCGG